MDIQEKRWNLIHVVHEALSICNRSQDKHHFYGKLKGSGTFFGGNIQQETRDSPPKNEPDPDL